MAFRDLKFGIQYLPGKSGIDPAGLADLARHVESCGYEFFYVPEHVCLYPSANEERVKLGLPATDHTRNIPDPLEVLSFVAAVTDRLILGTAILVLPVHQPVMLAKRLATLDNLSGGRTRITVGMGYLIDEIESCGADFKTRGRLADESIDAMRALWAADENGASFEGEFFNFHELCIYPKPVQPDGVPIHIGGASLAAARRAGRRGNGYFPTAPLRKDGQMTAGLTDEEMAEHLAVIRQEAEASGRDPDAVPLTLAGFVGMDEAGVAELADRGASRVLVFNMDQEAGLQQIKDELSAFAEQFEVGTA